MLAAILGGALSVVALSSGLLLCMRGVQARPPGEWERRIVTRAKHSFLVRSKDLANPLPRTHENIVEGQRNFSHYCFVCHGLDGQNTGVPFAQQMSPPVADLKSADVQAYTDGQLHWIIENGINPSGMPAWKGILEEDEMWKIVRYMRHLPPKGSLGAPEVFKEEEEEHKEMESGAGHKHAAGGERPH